MIEQTQLFFWMLICIIAAGLVFSARAFSFIDKNNESRVSQIDGLRFLLASLVLFHHYILSYFYFNGKDWALAAISDYPINQKIGGIGVALFFMISGYIFANIKIVSWPKFYVKRLLRIAPLLTLSSLLCLLIAAWIQRNNIEMSDIFMKAYLWFDAGIYGNKPDVFGMTNVSLINAATPWTLFWEWGFYFSLPWVFLLRDRAKPFVLSFSALFFCMYVLTNWNTRNAILISFFAIGFLAKEMSMQFQLKKTHCNIGIIAAILLSFAIKADAYQLYCVPVIALIFIMIAMGGDVFRLLRLKGFIRLGDVSYSIYLLHGIFWFCLNHYIKSHSIILTTTEYITISSVVFFLILLISTLTYRFIERPFIDISRRL
ncbi:acyltransferase family protein [Serratia sp. NPDC078593]|uniref:acyltransferase family protein n=1 Tax=unclassified Serratia (in: enterobacteria) TaxID=2647522 RepID=UPI0037D9120A